MKSEWFITKDIIEQIKDDMSENLGYGASKIDRDLIQAFDSFDAKTLDMLAFVLGRVLLLVKRMATDKARQEDAEQEMEHMQNEIRRGVFNHPPARAI